MPNSTVLGCTTSVGSLTSPSIVRSIRSGILIGSLVQPWCWSESVPEVLSGTSLEAVIVNVYFVLVLVYGNRD